MIRLFLFVLAINSTFASAQEEFLDTWVGVLDISYVPKASNFPVEEFSESFTVEIRKSLGRYFLINLITRYGSSGFRFTIDADGSIFAYEDGKAVRKGVYSGNSLSWVAGAAKRVVFHRLTMLDDELLYEGTALDKDLSQHFVRRAYLRR